MPFGPLGAEGGRQRFSFHQELKLAGRADGFQSTGVTLAAKRDLVFG